MNEINQKICQKCGSAFLCFDSSCWCTDLPKIVQVDPALNCRCPSCLKELVKEKIEEFMGNLTPENMDMIKALGTPDKTMEGIDYYINEAGLFVFTSWYHLRRGTCCGNGCKHCPYKSEDE
ncbi:MAG: DUF5522 domain-containing protein [Cyclobacteriaceae bacterium]|nr:DUF5522 domain-containing protein [Cyclobacteriaceae bacterium]